MLDDRDDRRRPNERNADRRSRDEMIRYLRDFKGLVQSYTEIVADASPEIFEDLNNYTKAIDHLMVDAGREYEEGREISQVIRKYVPKMNKLRHEIEETLTFEVEKVEENFWEERTIEEMVTEIESRKTRLRKIAENNNRGTVRNREYRMGTDTIYDDLRLVNSRFKDDFSKMQSLREIMIYADRIVYNFDDIIRGEDKIETREPEVTAEEIRENIDDENEHEELIEKWAGDIRQ
ncbi:MAG: hypothetical protein ABEJ56_00610 [Candidatus Nanohaloarchaea archaeon]